ncbi:MAG: F0F1 ATP synthase subunit C [Alphaproteobacteria bacterium]
MVGIDAVALVGLGSVISAGIAVGMGGLAALGEGQAAKQALASMVSQPDQANEVRSTMFVAMAMIESTAIYALLVAMILLFSNPIFNKVVELAAAA